MKHTRPIPGISMELLRSRFGAAPEAALAIAGWVADRLEQERSEGIWIQRRSRAELLAAAAELAERRRQGDVMPLFGFPFAVKDNIDVLGLPTTAACPGFSYLPTRSARVVERLLAAGALLVGKTNLDQFATGLVGVRSPYGVPTNPYDDRYITGGSSSGSAAAVARGLVTFALGTDTAGSGRVPAGFTNLVGLKPSRGLLSTTGVVPACRSLDCVSVFASSIEEATRVADVAGGFDAQDPFSRSDADHLTFSGATVPSPLRLGVPVDSDLNFFGDTYAESAFRRVNDLLRTSGIHLQPVPMDKFFEVARLLYEGPWIAERLAGLEQFLTEHPDDILPITRQILSSGQRFSAADAFLATHRLQALKQSSRGVWDEIDALVVPTSPSIYRIEEVLADPLQCNARLGLYTNFVNLLDLAALAIPSGFRADGLPVGITLIGPAGHDARLAAIGTLLMSKISAEDDRLDLVVVGAHLAGQPLNHELTHLGGRLVREGTTTSGYKLFALAGTSPPKPGLLRVKEGGTSIAIEVWSLPAAAVGTFLRGVKAPLGLGTIELEDGSTALGFLCEAHATQGGRDISTFGGWKAFRATQT